MKTPVLIKVPWRSWAQGRSWSRLSGTHSSTTSLQHLQGLPSGEVRIPFAAVCRSARGGGGGPLKSGYSYFLFTQQPKHFAVLVHRAGHSTVCPRQDKGPHLPHPPPPPPPTASLSLSERLPRPSLLLPVPCHPSAPTAALILLSCL